LEERGRGLPGFIDIVLSQEFVTAFDQQYHRSDTTRNIIDPFAELIFNCLMLQRDFFSIKKKERKRDLQLEAFQSTRTSKIPRIPIKT
jgi:hypothetical protein